MTIGLASLVLGYMLSQFFRMFLAVLSPVLGAEIGARPEDLATSLGIWYAAFALMQIPVGRLLDSVGPRRTVPSILALGAGSGALVFALAQGPWGVHLAMALIGAGCAPVLMGSYYLVARTLPAAVFGAYAGGIVAVGSLGNILGTAPLVWLIDAAGWRATLIGLSVVTVLVAAAIYLSLRDPERVVRAQGEEGSLADILRIPGLWAILALIFMNYAAVAGLRGVWAGPFLTELHGVEKTVIGWITLAMSLAMVAGNFAYGAADRLFGGHKPAIIGGTLIMLAALAALALAPKAPLFAITALLCMVGFFGAAFPALVAHGRSFMPAHLVGRGVTLLNLFSITGAGLMQFASRPVYKSASASGDLPHAYSMLFLFFLIPLALGLFAYLFAPKRP